MSKRKIERTNLTMIGRCTKHAETYEESKKVSNIRIAWDKDADRIVANLEISLKSIQKG